MSHITVVNPTSGNPIPDTGMRILIDDMTGKTVGFFSNNKPNADVVLARLEELLQQRFGIVARRYRKVVPSLGAEPSLLDEISRECQAVVVAGFD